MTDDILKLAYRWHRLESFRFVPGMAVVHEETGERARLVEVVYLGEKYPDEYDEHDICAEAVIIEGPLFGPQMEFIHPSDMWSWLPDLSEPATVGILIHQAREANECFVVAIPEFHGDYFNVKISDGEHLRDSYDLPNSELEAYVWAIESAEEVGQ